jgi:hypothetical protein
MGAAVRGGGCVMSGETPKVDYNYDAMKGDVVTKPGAGAKLAKGGMVKKGMKMKAYKKGGMC